MEIPYLHLSPRAHQTNIRLSHRSQFYTSGHVVPSSILYSESKRQAAALRGEFHRRSATQVKKEKKPPKIGARTQERADLGLQYLEMGTNGLLDCQQQDLLSSSYEAAMEALSSLITKRKRGNGSKRTEKFDQMFGYLQALGLDQHIASLKIIHIAGTKGKGSTCTFSEAILRECGLQTGLFTSPHLMDVRERYRINGSDISRKKFLLHFWECWHQLKAKSVNDLPMPTLFQFLTLLALKIFLSEKVDVAILEVGLGGRFDSTNVVKEPVVTGITSLGMDHMEILGDTIEKISFEKAGIFKPHVPAFTVPQCSEAMSVLCDRASKLMIPLEVAPPLGSKALKGLHLGLAGDHQFINAGLAVALCRCWLRRTGRLDSFPNENWDSTLPEPFLRGLSTAHLSGRAQIFHDELDYCSERPENKNHSGDLIFYLDGAHSPESMEVCARWFSNVTRDVHSSHENGYIEKADFHKNLKNENCHNVADKVSRKILLFNCMEVRDPHLLFPQLINTCASNGVQFAKALFVPSMSTYHKIDSGASAISSDISQDVSWQTNLQRVWEKLIHGKKDATIDNCLNSEKLTSLSSAGLFSEDSLQRRDQAENKFPNSAVIPSLPLTVKLLRDCVRENPTLRLQVLVTGSLHLVGDVLRLLKR
ncbi:folylpolyglutamate synthase-like isoform X2 [Phalaenopsis equestris]|uniref:folylpolyglutamate synthase-like isoform X2 n=1 Tax=Phalaenopsis equestris TaxID=78828 RepID=UPI0009E486E5|nr:folylpolyglutamate synthase-like isoform X2 [Phalaenopsis equestris]